MGSKQAITQGLCNLTEATVQGFRTLFSFIECIGSTGFIGFISLMKFRGLQDVWGL